jgi:hypothetical protein
LHVIAQDVVRLVIDTNGILASADFFAAGGFEELRHDLRDRVILEEKA